MKISKEILYSLIPLIIAGSIILAIIFIDKSKHGSDRITDQNAGKATQNQDILEDNLNNTLNPNQVQDWIGGSNDEDNASTQTVEPTDQSDTTPSLIAPTYSNLPVAQSAWLPSWAQSTGMKSITNNQTQFSYIMPVWYSADKNGNLIDRKPSGYNDLFTLAKNQDFKVLPSIGMFDADNLSEILSGDSLQNHINQIVNELNRYDYAGIDLDYEMIYLADKPKWEEFIKKLSITLHNNNKLLSVTVLPKWGDEISYTGLKETREVQDWAYLNEYADQVRIMAYDKTSSAATVAGPIGPIDWQEDIIQYSLIKLDREKIWLGVHLYGYSWNENGFVSSTVAEDIPNILDKATFQQYSDIIHEGYAEYPCGTNNTLHCKIYYQTNEGVKARYDLAQSYGIGGLAYWRLGQDADLRDINISN